MKHQELTDLIIGICIRVHKILGPGLLEICLELKYEGIKFQRQHGFPVVYKEIKAELGFRADIIVEGKIIVEVKSIETIAPIHCKILQTYMRFSELEVGLLINFNVVLLKHGIKRIILDHHKKTELEY